MTIFSQHQVVFSFIYKIYKRNLLDPDRQSLERTSGKHADLAVGTRFGTGGSGDLVGDLHLGGGFHGKHRVVPLHFGCEVLSTRRARLGDVVDVVAVPVEGSTIRNPLNQTRRTCVSTPPPMPCAI